MRDTNDPSPSVTAAPAETATLFPITQLTLDGVAFDEVFPTQGRWLGYHPARQDAQFLQGTDSIRLGGPEAFDGPYHCDIALLEEGAARLTFTAGDHHRTIDIPVETLQGLTGRHAEMQRRGEENVRSGHPAVWAELNAYYCSGTAGIKASLASQDVKLSPIAAQSLYGLLATMTDRAASVDGQPRNAPAR